MHLPTRKSRRQERWLVRRAEVDFGPYTNDQLLEEIALHHVDLGTPICQVGTQDWEPAGTHALFRDHYARCETRWRVEEAEQAADKHEQKLKTMRVIKGSTWALILGGALVVLLFGGWLTWRFMHLQPSGILNAVALASPAPLPPPPSLKVPLSRLQEPEIHRFPVLKEPETYDTAGVGGEGSGAALVTRMEFDENGGGGGGASLSEGQLKQITEHARGQLVGCAQAAATRSATFTGTKVTFIVRSGGLGSITVGPEVRSNQPFKACVKRALKGISVPKFAGSERRVTVPLHVKR